MPREKENKTRRLISFDPDVWEAITHIHTDHFRDYVDLKKVTVEINRHLRNEYKDIIRILKEKKANVD